MRRCQDVCDCSIINTNLLNFGGFTQCLRGRLRRKWTDFRKLEQPLGVGLGVAHLAAQLREASTDQRDGQFSLRAAVERGDKNGQLRVRHILQLIDEQHQRAASTLCSRAYCLEESLQIVLKIAIGGEAWFWLIVVAHFNVVVLDLQRLGESGEGTERPSGASIHTA